MGNIQTTLLFHPHLLPAIRTNDFTFPFVCSRLDRFDILFSIFKETLTCPARYPPFVPVLMTSTIFTTPFLKTGVKKHL